MYQSLTGCALVQCSLTVDDVVKEVHYNQDKLAVVGDLNDWRKEKTISFESCDQNEPGTLTVRGKDYNMFFNCNKGGLLLHCTASDETSPWHNFKSDAEHWTVENGELCQKDFEGWLPPFINNLEQLGAKKIWAAKREVTLIGSPK